MLLGIVLYLGLKGYRFMRAPGVDKSNFFNFLRAEFWDCIHAGNRAQLYFLEDEAVDYLEEAGYDIVCPYAYISGDEFSDHFPYTRPDSGRNTKNT